MTKEEIKKIIDLIIIEEKKTLEQVLTLEMFNLWQDTDQQTQLLKSELEQTTLIAKTKTKQVEVLKKEVEASMSTINKLSGGTLSGILEEEITQLKKQLKEREEQIAIIEVSNPQTIRVLSGEVKIQARTK
jgi:hypothetical protein